ncbi:PilZ domain-containing protein [Novosphingobium beihaiensis]|uniref:PilZ domain-containing protein n=1 Tax=Novosphingobium beihaiensis TaxID=2930389 RepID=A0ABT0BV07_9SPHN|nr:PilZ domain-containing protein [Novosphingobium beihaiensis]MCJ2188900.1 PilZ domain-containing protein [Novosphingobium beihaiensis]
MNEGDNRQVARDSLFLMADLRVGGLDGEYRIKVRNLSAGGMMGEGAVRVVRGAMVEVNIRNVGWVEGSVAWVQENRFGVAFSTDIDPKLARAPVSAAEDTAPRFVRNHEAHFAPGENIRKI